MKLTKIEKTRNETLDLSLRGYSRYTEMNLDELIELCHKILWLDWYYLNAKNPDEADGWFNRYKIIRNWVFDNRMFTQSEKERFIESTN